MPVVPVSLCGREGAWSRADCCACVRAPCASRCTRPSRPRACRWSEAAALAERGALGRGGRMPRRTRREGGPHGRAPSCRAPPRSRASHRRQALQRGIDRIVDRPALAPAFWGIEVRSLRSGRVLYARNAGKNFKPASTLKLVTTAAALDAFGPDERLRTTVETAGRLDAFGRVLGDVYLVGRRRPEPLGPLHGRPRARPRSRSWRTRSWTAGVRRIEGRLVGHEGLFTGDRRGEDWTWGDLVWWYGAEVSALSFNDNCADLIGPRRASARATRCAWSAPPRRRYYRVVSTATTSAAGTPPDLTLARAPGIERDPPQRHATPGRRGLGRLRGPRGPRALRGHRVRARCWPRAASRSRGASPPLRSRCRPAARVLAAHESPPLPEILKAVNKPSQNLHAEMLLRLLGARRSGVGSAGGRPRGRGRSSCGAWASSPPRGRCRTAPASRAPTSSRRTRW